MEGWLEKKYPTKTGLWKRWWFELHDTTVRYFEDERGQERGRMNIGHGSRLVSSASMKQEQAGSNTVRQLEEKPFSFILDAERLFILSAPDAAALQAWSSAIADAVEEMKLRRPGSARRSRCNTVATSCSLRSRKSTSRATWKKSDGTELPGAAGTPRSGEGGGETPCCGRARLASTCGRAGMRRSTCFDKDSVLGSALYTSDPRPIWKVYQQEARLGSGTFGTVFKAKEIASGAIVALKRMDKMADEEVLEDAMSEFLLCARVAHPNIMRVFAFFDAPEAVYIASEYAANGELSDFLAVNKDLATELGIAKITTQILSALVYLHGRHLIHHDVKPANILVTEQHWSFDRQVPVVVLSDFGTARLCQSMALQGHAKSGGLVEMVPRGPVVTQEGILLGTPEYCGPEVFEGRSGDRTDVYALGVTLFELLSGELPYNQKLDAWMTYPSYEDQYEQMLDKTFEADWSRLQDVSDQGRALIKRMMNKEYALRPTAAICAEDRWFNYHTCLSIMASVPLEEFEARSRRLQQRAQMRFYGKAVMNLMAAQISGDLLQREKEVFKKLDVNGSGQIDATELLAAFRILHGWTKEQADSVLESLDLDGTGYLEFNEWVAATMFVDPGADAGSLQRVKALWVQLDSEGRGYIGKAELHRAVGVLPSDEDDEALEAFVAELDLDGDGKISYEEFEEFWKQVAS